MVAERRARKKPLIRVSANTAVPAANKTSTTNAASRYPETKEPVVPISRDTYPETRYFSPAAAASSQRFDTLAHLHQLYALHASGVLTDEEFLSARRRLLAP